MCMLDRHTSFAFFVFSRMLGFYKEFEVIEIDYLFSDGQTLLRSVLKFHSTHPYTKAFPLCSTKQNQNGNRKIHMSLFIILT